MLFGIGLAGPPLPRAERRAASRKAAQAELAEQLEVTIEAETRHQEEVLETVRDGHWSVSSRSLLSTDIATRSAADLRDLSVADDWEDRGEAHWWTLVKLDLNARSRRRAARARDLWAGVERAIDRSARLDSRAGVAAPLLAVAGDLEALLAEGLLAHLDEPSRKLERVGAAVERAFSDLRIEEIGGPEELELGSSEPVPWRVRLTRRGAPLADLPLSLVLEPGAGESRGLMVQGHHEHAAAVRTDTEGEAEIDLRVLQPWGHGLRVRVGLDYAALAARPGREPPSGEALELLVPRPLRPSLRRVFDTRPLALRVEARVGGCDTETAASFSRAFVEALSRVCPVALGEEGGLFVDCRAVVAPGARTRGIWSARIEGRARVALLDERSGQAETLAIETTKGFSTAGGAAACRAAAAAGGEALADETARWLFGCSGI